MKKEDRRSFVAILILLLIATGFALAGSQGGHDISGFPIYTLCIAIAFIIQWIVFIPAYLNRTEKFYDLPRSLTYITVPVVVVLLTPTVDTRPFLLPGISVVWAVRLGSFLFLRIRAAGEDRRFREIKQSFTRFLLARTLQGLWASFSFAAALAAITSMLWLDLDLFALIGFLVWVFDFAIEMITDG